MPLRGGAPRLAASPAQENRAAILTGRSQRHAVDDVKGPTTGITSLLIATHRMNTYWITSQTRLSMNVRPALYPNADRHAAQSGQRVITKGMPQPGIAQTRACFRLFRFIVLRE